MGYFSNGTEGELYEARYCSRCVHGNDEPACAVWAAHMFHNYDECNKPGSILHELIPRGERGENLECKLFKPKGGGPKGGPPVPLLERVA